MVIGSILHGAYGDYYEQALCLKHWKLTHPGARLELFFASPHRMAELRVFDWSFADGVYLWDELQRRHVDQMMQFQVRDAELQADVIAHLPAATRALLPEDNRLPWHYIRRYAPFAAKFQLELSAAGVARRAEIEAGFGLDARVWERPTIGFLWRYRAPGGAIKNLWPSDPSDYAAKYSRVFRRLIDAFDCHVLICGMKVRTTQENAHRVDNKYPEFGLDLPSERSSHLTGQSWGAEMEILTKCDLTLSNPSGFSEALWLRRGSDALVVDPPAHYVALLAKHRMPLFDFLTPAGMIHAVTVPHGEDRIVRYVAKRLRKKGYTTEGHASRSV